MRLGLVVASLVLVAGGATGCGGDAASKEEFCEGYQAFINALFGVDPEGGDYVEKLKDAAQDFEEVGVPDDIPDDARQGLETVLDAIQDLDDDATEEDIAKIEEEFSEEDNKNTDAFETYLGETCPDLGAPESEG